MRVASLHAKPSSYRIDLKYNTIFAQETVAINSASIELIAVTDYVLERYTIAPPQKFNTNSVVDRHLRLSFA